IFQDREELATSGDLAASVKAALEASATLIVICSPAAARSRWVNEEIRTFTALGRRDRIQCLVVGGQPNASRREGLDPALEAFPPALFEGGAAEPLAADIRPGQDDRLSARLKLIAGILGVGFDELRQREHARRHRRMAIVTGASAAGFLAMAGLAGFAVVQRGEAIRQRDIAREKSLTAERTVSFVKSMFQVADPSEARGETITAREILDRGAKQLEHGLENEPTVKGELSATLGEVYASLGLFRPANDLLQANLRQRGVAPATRARELVALGEAQWGLDDYAASAKSQGDALALTGRLPEAAALRSRALIGLADAQIRMGQGVAGLKNAQAALAAEQARKGVTDADLALAYERVGEAQLYGGDPHAARPNIQKALDLRLRAQGATHPMVASDNNTLAAIAYMGGDLDAAEQGFRRALESYEAVLGADHPKTASALNNLARVLLEKRRFAEAEPLLRRAVDIRLAHVHDTADDLVFEYTNLGIAERGLGRLAQAEVLLEKAERAARLNKHRNLAPIMVERAEIACATGAPARGARLAEEAAPIMAAAYHKDAWRTAWLQVVRGDCLALAGHAAEGAALIKANSSVVAARWSPATLYGERLARIQARR
ncbi:MAG TPA: tetratricopeptide repeat protein, partial [Phenylobacterium sp.]|nr:tetratricopeptide repeat protein [Phenylobacterium sp.]